MPLIINCIRWLIAGTNDNYMSCLSETRLLTKGVGKKLSLVVANIFLLQVTLQVSFDVDAETASGLAITRNFIHFQEKHSIY